MAERRSLHKKISVSEDHAELGEAHGPWAVVFATYAIAHYDRWGCIPASPRRLKATIVPYHDAITPSDIQEWTDWMVDAGQLERITGPDGDEGLRNPKFLEHQTGAKLDRESPSPYEPVDITQAWTRNRSTQGSPDQVGTRSGPESDQVRRRKEGRKGSPSRGTPTTARATETPPAPTSAGAESGGSPVPDEIRDLPEPSPPPTDAGDLITSIAEQHRLAANNGNGAAKTCKTCRAPWTGLGVICDTCIETGADLATADPASTEGTP